VIARAGARRVALRVDAVEALVEVDGATIEDARDAVPSVEHVAGVVRTGEGIVLIHDVHRFLTDAEARSLEGALAADMAESATAISTQ
jgi:chemotaxis signal transduction protein